MWSLAAGAAFSLAVAAATTEDAAGIHAASVAVCSRVSLAGAVAGAADCFRSCAAIADVAIACVMPCVTQEVAAPRGALSMPAAAAMAAIVKAPVVTGRVTATVAARTAAVYAIVFAATAIAANRAIAAGSSRASAGTAAAMTIVMAPVSSRSFTSSFVRFPDIFRQRAAATALN